MALYDVPIGADPTPQKGQSSITNTFTVWDGNQFRTVDMGAGSWRACKGESEHDYQLYLYDGKALSRVWYAFS